MHYYAYTSANGKKLTLASDAGGNPPTGFLPVGDGSYKDGKGTVLVITKI